MMIIPTTPRPSRPRDPSRRARSDPAAGAGLDDLIRLAEGRLAPDRLAGADNRDRREGLYAAAGALAGRPDHADLCRNLVVGLQRRAKDARRALEGRAAGGGRPGLEAAAGEFGVMAYVFALRRFYHRILEAEVARLQRKDRALDEAAARDVVEWAFTRAVLGPASDLGRGTGVIAATVDRELLGHYRREGRRRAACAAIPKRARLVGRRTAQVPRVEEELAARQVADALVRVASGVPGRRGAAIMALLGSDGSSGIVAVARRLDIPVNTAKSLAFAARTEFRRLAERDPDTGDAMRMFGRTLDLRRRGSHSRGGPRG